MRAPAVRAVSHADAAVVPGPHQEVPPELDFAVEEFEGVAAPVADVHPTLARCQRLQVRHALQPQQRLAILPVPPLRDGLSGRHLGADMQDLVDQAQDGLVRGDRQAVVTEVALAKALAELAQMGVQGRVAGEIQFGGVMQKQDGAPSLTHLSEGGLPVCVEESRVGDVGAVQQVVAAAQGVGVMELLGKAAAGMADEAVGQIDQGTGPAAVAQGGPAEVLLSELVRQRKGGRHRVAP